jgi:hypothetical protein
MRLELGPVIANLLLLAAGLGIVNAVGVLAPTLRGLLAVTGLAYLAGVSLVMIVGIALLTVGVAFTLPAFTAVSVLVAVFGLAARRNWLGQLRAAQWKKPVLRRPSLSVYGWIPLITLAVAGAISVVVFRAVGFRPLSEWDGWSIWTRKAEALFYFGNLSTGFFASHAYTFMHADYPILIPVFESIQFRAMGTIDTQSIHAELWLLLVAFVWALAFVAARDRPPLYWAPLVVIPLVGGIWSQLLTAYADIPMALFLALGIVLLGYWLESAGPQDLVLGTLFLAAAANTKNEGLIGGAIALIAAAVLVAVRRQRPLLWQIGGAIAGFALAVLPWRFWIADHHITTDVPVGKSLHPGYLTDRTDRIWPSVKALYAQILDQSSWSYIIPLGIAITVLALAVPLRRRIAIFYLATGIAFFLSLVWVYWIATTPLTFYLATSAYRVVAGLVAIALAAIVQIGVPSREPLPREQDEPSP